MIVEQVEAFKTWLTAVLKPMCEADPAALAKYVLALIKKDKSEDELRKSMVAQLDVFLEAETESFVDLVFQTLTTKEYMNVPIVPNTNPPNPNMGKVKEPAKESKVIIQPSELPNLNEAVNGNAKKEQEVKRDRENRLENRKNSDAEKEKEKDKEKDKEKEREDRPLRVLRRSPVTIRHRSLSRNRSRSRSWDRTKRSRSREKSRERDQHRVDRDKRDRPRIWRNKSPPRSRYDRRRGAASRTPSPPLLGRARTRSRSPRHAHRSRYHTRTSTSRSRSRSPDAKRDRRDSAKDKDAAGSRPGSPAQDSNHGDMDARLSNTAHNLQGGAGKKKRCRDFDEKGYCMSGDMCPFDHGVDPVVLEDAALSRVLTYNPNGGPAGGPRAPLHSVVPDNPYNPQAPQLWRDFRPGGPGGRVPPMGIARVPPLGPYPPATNMNRELIPVPVMDNGGPKPPDGYPPMVGPPYHPPGVPPFPPHHDGYKKRGPFDFNRLGPVRHQQKNPQNCSLELKKVPNGMNTITHLNNHFGKFGKIVNIQVQYEGDPEAALITFSSHAEANAAYRSTEAVLNNRFIKVFWHNSNPQQPADAKHQENVPPSMRSVKDRLGTQASQAVPPNANKVFNLVQPKADDTSAPGVPGEEKPQDASSGDEKTKEENHTQAVEAIKKGQELLAAQAKVRKNQDVQRKQVIQIQCDLRKKKQELLDKQLSQQKILVEKMEKMPPGPARDLIKDTIKKTQEAIAAITKDLEAAALAASKASAAKPKTKEEAQRELLDAELDLIAKQQEGADTKELQKKLNELRAKVAAAGAVTRGGRIGRRYPLSTPVIGRHLLTKNNLKLKAMKTVNRPSTTSQTSTALNTTFQKHTVDHRPTKLLVSGYETDEQDSVLSHFQQYGEIADYEVDASIPSITLNYKSRKEAEMALLKGKHFQDRTLSITWSTSKQLNRQRSSGSTSTRTVVMSETEEDQLIDSNILDGAEEDLGPEISEEALLQDDEEEEDEDRSWRR